MVVCMKILENGTTQIVEETDDYNDYDEIISKCDILTKPAALQRCNEKSCGSNWHYTSWSEVSLLSTSQHF